MRGILTDWLVQVHVRFRLMPETLFLCINIIDRFLSARVVSLAKLQLVGITCLFVASKVEEIVSPSVSHFLYCADSSYTENEILQAERYVLKTIDWNLSYPNPIHFLRRVSKADEYDVKARTIAKYLLEIGCLEWRLLSVPPSLMAAAAIWLARLILDHETWVSLAAFQVSVGPRLIYIIRRLRIWHITRPTRRARSCPSRTSC
jgi:G2/mitotic-specific cyclin 2